MEEQLQDAATGAEPFYASPELWVAVAFLLFVGLLVYLKVPQMVTRSLDKRSAAIAAQIEEARRLREEAEALLAQYQRKQREAQTEAAAIVAHAETEAKRLAAEAQTALEAGIARREQLAVEKIAQAEAAAIKEVRTVAVEVATAAARRVIAETLDPAKANQLVDDAIRELPQHLH
jgi:F-type H+-transporting ATPase subunit b